MARGTKKAAAVERLRTAGLEPVAAALDRWRNRDLEDGGWDAWFASAHKEHCALVGLQPRQGAARQRRAPRHLAHRPGAARLHCIAPTAIPGERWPILPDLIVHADWSSTRGPKRQVARALLREGRCRVTSPRPACPELLEWLLAKARAGRAVLAGFDFAIGVPAAYARAARAAAAREGTDLGESFLDLVRRVPPEFFAPQDDPLRVSWRQPFFPATNAGWGRLRTQAGGERQDGLARRILGDPRATRSDLLRRTDRATEHRPAASALFLLAGGAQVGKASIAGLREVVLPALERHRRVVRVWPFDGRLSELVQPGTVTLVETYPAECLRHLGVGNSAKTDQVWRREAGEAIARYASGRGIAFSARLRAALEAGFGPTSAGEDPFDATAGAVQLALLALGHDAVGEPEDAEARAWEGAIVGSMRVQVQNSTGELDPG